MNWGGDLIQKEIKETDIVLDLGCGIMQSTLDVYEGYPQTRLNPRVIVGVEIYRPYLERIKDKEGIVVLNMGVNDLSMFLDKSFDVVMGVDIVEHLEEEEAYKLLAEMERIARRKVIVYTPARFYDNVEGTTLLSVVPYVGFGANPYQRHRCLIPPDWFREHEYRVSLDNPDKNTFAVKELAKC